MSGFSASRSGVMAAPKQYGSILRGWGPPVPKAGVLGDLYIDNLTFQLFEKRCFHSLDDWGHYLFVVPSVYRNTLKWFGPNRPNDSIGIANDYFLQWGGYNNYGMYPTIFGPKLISGWPENGGNPDSSGGPSITVAQVFPLGVSDEGPPLTDMMPNQLIAVGLLDEYIIPASVTANPGEPVPPVGVPSTGQQLTVTLNPLYTAEDEHAI